MPSAGGVIEKGLLSVNDLGESVAEKEAEKNLTNPREKELLLLYRAMHPEKQNALRHMAKLLSE